MEFGDALHCLRSELDLTQSELAAALRTTGATVSRWEAGISRPTRTARKNILEYARMRGVSEACRDALSQKPRKRVPADAALAPETVLRALLRVDYETVAAIDAATGEARAYTGGHLEEVLLAQKAAGDSTAGVAAYLRAHCVDDDVDRVIRETSLAYVTAQLAKKPVVTTAYSLKQDGKIVRKRVLFTYLDDDKTTILCAMQNLTETYRQGVMQRTRLSAAAETLQEVSGLNIARYDLKTRTFFSNCDLTARLGYGEVIENVPEAFIEAGHVAPGSVAAFRAFYDNLRSGVVMPLNASLEVAGEGFHWIHGSARLVCGEEGAPEQAIIVFQDVETQREQAAVYQKWRQSLERRSPDDYTLFRCNLSKGASFDRTEGRLLTIQFDPHLTTFNERTREYAGRFVHLDDFDDYVTLLNSENLLAGYYRGTRTAALHYRERVAEDEYRWIRLTVEMTQYPDSEDVEVFLMYEPCERAQLEDAAAKARMDTDPLTGVLNRRAFVERFTALIAAAQPDAGHALLLVDIDDFRRVNEHFGHAVGDQALIDIARSLKAAVRKEDLLGRLGGDEFLICLAGVTGQAAVERKATQILASLRKVFSVDIRVTASIGIAFFPNDGGDFTALYHSVDLALYTAKGNGTDSFAFFSGELLRPVGAGRAERAEAAAPGARQEKPPARRMLLMDNDPKTRALVQGTFAGQYDVEVCADAEETVAGLHRYGFSLSAVLVGMDVPDVDALALLRRIRRIGSVRSVPVIALGRVRERARCRQALTCGANDFILLPADAALVRVRVESAVGKAENERLRAQNAYLQTQSSDASQFRAVYENTGTVVVEYDWNTHAFVYDPCISEHLYGRYDGRSLWQIFMSDMVADAQDVKAMQELILSLANARHRTAGAIDVRLKTPQKVMHWFTMNAFKRVNDRDLPSKIILTFLDVNENILASKKLRFQAEHDSLTGLYNRSSFIKLVGETVGDRPPDSFILLCCDINDFRFINERYGREEGDKLLKYAAEKLRVYASAMDGFAGRLSNDVYAVLLPNTPGMLDRARALTESFFEDYPLKTKITGRAGAYIVTDPGMTADAMLDMASTASGAIKGKFASWLAVYDDSMNEKRLREKRVTDRMETALAGGQFDVYFQPQFHHATGKIVGAEALVRWIDPKRGVIPPAEFIPVFERNGFITRLDAYVWEKTAAYVEAWMQKGNAPVPVSVNVSREDTNDPALCDKLLAIVRRHGIPVKLFRLEITESLFAEDAERLADVVATLHRAGFLVEMDDFGSGYSSLNILKDVPVDILKLDMRFLSGSDNLSRGGVIVNAVLRMARWLNIPVIAEGVERREQADFLLSVGCPTIQGYLYEKPMPAAAFEQKLLSCGNGGDISKNTIETTLSAHGFWDPLSEDTQLFNHYIGPAAVLEAHGDACELVRFNARFAALVGMPEADGLPAPDALWIVDTDRPKFLQAVRRALRTCEDGKVYVHCAPGAGGEARRVRVTLRVIAKSDDCALLFALLDE